MDITFLLKVACALIIILAIALFFLFYSNKKNKATPIKSMKKQSNPPDFQALQAILSNRDSNKDALHSAAEDILNYYGTIPAKVNFQMHPDFEVYAKLMIQICKHPNTDTNLIISFEKKLQEKNPHYVKEIATALTKALA